MSYQTYQTTEAYLCRRFMLLVIIHHINDPYGTPVWYYIASDAWYYNPSWADSDDYHIHINIYIYTHTYLNNCTFSCEHFCPLFLSYDIAQFNYVPRITQRNRALLCLRFHIIWFYLYHAMLLHWQWDNNAFDPVPNIRLVCYSMFLHAKPWTPGDEKAVFTAVIY